MKNLLCILICAFILTSTLMFSAFAENEASGVAFIDYSGADDNDGTTAESPKKTFGKALSLLADGGTLVVSGKAYIATNYTLPKLNGPLTITSVFEGIDYKNPEPLVNPACAMKLSSGKTLTIIGEVTLDNLILFQEFEQNTIVVKEGGVLTITDTIICMSRQGYYMDIIVEKGGKAIIQSGVYSSITGAGDITITDNITVTPSPDVNGDCNIDISDVMNCLKAYMNGSKSQLFDFNGDKNFTLVDVIKILKYVIDY